MVQPSKYLSLVLRHDPAAAGVTLGPAGWVRTDARLKGAGRAGVSMSRQGLDRVVATNADGTTAAIYGEFPPLVNVCREPGAWQTYDIIFTHPRVKNGKVVEPAYVTVLQNGVLLQNHQRIEGPTGHMIVAHYPENLADHGPLELQFHGNPVRYRNIWLRKLHNLDVQQHTGEVASTGGQAGQQR